MDLSEINELPAQGLVDAEEARLLAEEAPIGRRGFRIQDLADDDADACPVAEAVFRDRQRFGAEAQADLDVWLQGELAAEARRRDILEAVLAADLSAAA